MFVFVAKGLEDSDIDIAIELPTVFSKVSVPVERYLDNLIVKSIEPIKEKYKKLTKHKNNL